MQKRRGKLSKAAPPFLFLSDCTVVSSIGLALLKKRSTFFSQFDFISIPFAQSCCIAIAVAMIELLHISWCKARHPRRFIDGNPVLVAVKYLNKTGPKPDTVVIEGDWKDAVGKALKKKRPPGGWPKDGKK